MSLSHWWGQIVGVGGVGGTDNPDTSQQDSATERPGVVKGST